MKEQSKKIKSEKKIKVCEQLVHAHTRSLVMQVICVTSDKGGVAGGARPGGGEEEILL